MTHHRVTESLLKSVANSIQSFFSARSPQTRRVSLSHRNIYIIPTKASLWALLIVIILLIAGVNYQNNLMYLFAFWLLTLVIWNFILGFYNLYQLTLTAVRAQNNYEGEPVQFQIALSTQQKSSRQFFVQLNEHFDIKKGGEISKFNLNKNDQAIWTAEIIAKQRGPLKLPRVYIYTTYPFGFAYAFSYANINLHAWVYPKHEECKQVIKQASPNQRHQGMDFDSLKSYESGDKIQRIHWQQYAKTGNLLTKQFVDESGDDLWIRWRDFPYIPTEVRLRHLSFLIHKACKHNQAYGLDMPAGRIEPHTGEMHKHQCLLLLAKHGFENTNV